MNLNFIGKEFDRLAKLEDFVNYEYEPKSNKKLGKRNIYYDDIKLDFINEVNTYGFSPFILKNFGDQRDDPNIMRFMTKKFNHGLTNYVKLETRAIAHHTTQEIKKYISKRKKVKKPKKKEVYSNIFLVKKHEDQKKDEVKENFLQKALLEVGGNKLNLSMDDEEEQANKEKENEEKIKKSGKSSDTNNKNNNESDMSQKNELSKNKKELILKEKELIEKKQEEKNIELLKKYMGINKGKYALGKHEIQQLPNLFNSDSKKTTLKLIFQNKGYNKKINTAGNELNRKILTLSKNKDLLSNKRDYIFKKLFSPGQGPAKRINTSKENTNINEVKTIRTEARSNYGKRYNGKKLLKDEFLLFAKARPYRYMATVEN